MNKPTAEFVRTTRTHHVFKLDCLCGYFAELGVPQSHKLPISCPDCGALYFMTKPSGLFVHPRLISVCNVGATAQA